MSVIARKMQSENQISLYYAQPKAFPEENNVRNSLKGYDCVNAF